MLLYIIRVFVQYFYRAYYGRISEIVDFILLTITIIIIVKNSLYGISFRLYMLICVCSYVSSQALKKY
jgi:hypothetical protein